MKKVDYHVHTKHSMDCDMLVDTLCEAALHAGVDEICITDHTEFGHPDAGADVPPNIPEWLADIQRARKKYPALSIRSGIEIGDNPLIREQIQAWHLALPVDFLLLSLHLVDNEDPYKESFFAGKEQKIVYRRYVEAKLESALAWRPDMFDSFAHIGYCAKFAPYPVQSRPLRWRHAPDAFDALFTYLAENGKAIEVNTSGMRSMGECLPDRELLMRFHEKGGEFVTLGSDAHRPEHVGKDIEHARMLAKACGLRYFLTFAERQPTPVLL